MYVLINGAFGIGKTTVARALRGHLPGATLFDPEWIGFVLKRLPGYERTDYQELRTWRRLTILGARSFGAASPVVVIPMAFSQLDYLDEVRSGLAAHGRPVHHFCLTAPLEIVRERLAARGQLLGDPRWAWVHRRAAECCRAHEHGAFAIRVPTTQATADAIARDLAARLAPSVP